VAVGGALSFLFFYIGDICEIRRRCHEFGYYSGLSQPEGLGISATK
jgi:hypothetical protein